MKMPEEPGSMKDTVVNIATALTMFALLLPIVAVVAGLSWRLFQWIAGL